MAPPWKATPRLGNHYPMAPVKSLDTRGFCGWPGSQPVGFEQPEPDLADRGERGHRVPQPSARHLAHDGDGRRVQQLAGARARDRGPDQDLALLVDNEPGPARVPVRGEPRARHLADLVIDGADLQGPARRR